MSKSLIITSNFSPIKICPHNRIQDKAFLKHKTIADIGLPVYTSVQVIHQSLIDKNIRSWSQVTKLVITGRQRKYNVWFHVCLELLSLNANPLWFIIQVVFYESFTMAIQTDNQKLSLIGLSRISALSTLELCNSWWWKPFPLTFPFLDSLLT